MVSLSLLLPLVLSLRLVVAVLLLLLLLLLWQRRLRRRRRRWLPLLESELELELLLKPEYLIQVPLRSLLLLLSPMLAMMTPLPVELLLWLKERKAPLRPPQSHRQLVQQSFARPHAAAWRAYLPTRAAAPAAAACPARLGARPASWIERGETRQRAH